MGNSQGFNTWATINWYMDARRSYGAAGYAAASKLFNKGDVTSMSGKVVAVTGANRGLGYAAAVEFAKLDAEVHLLCRSKAKADEAAAKIKAETSSDKVFGHQCDASSFRSINEFSELFCQEHSQLDVLVNNAGGMPETKQYSEEKHDSIMASALGGVLLLTDRLLPVLRMGKDKGRVINVVSGGGFTVKCPEVDDLDFEKMPKYDPTLFYALAKRAQILLTQRWPTKYNEENVRVFAMHPGWAITEGVNEALEGGRLGLSSTDGFRTAAQGVDTTIFLGSTLNENVLDPKTNGELFFDRKVTTRDYTWATQTSAEKQEALWNAAQNYVGLV